MGNEYDREIRNLIEYQLKSRGINDPRILDAFRSVKRHLFVNDSSAGKAYSDSPLPIGCGQTISQPYMVAKITEVADLQVNDKVLEIGAGSGYQAAIASRLCSYVYALEIIPELAEFARENLKKSGIKNVSIINASGYEGYPQAAPYDKIIVSAAATKIPEVLYDQLKTEGSLTAPVGEYPQTLYRITKTKEGLIEKKIMQCVFVPLVRNY